MGTARTLIGLVLLIVLAGLAVWVFVAMQGDDSKMLGYALGNETEDTMEIHVEVTILMANTDTYDYVNINGNVIWEDWANAHFIITDPQGGPVPLTVARKSNLVSEAQKGYPELFLIGTLRKGQAYHFGYIPVVGEPHKYSHTFTPTAANAGRQRVKFTLVP